MRRFFYIFLIICLVSAQAQSIGGQLSGKVTTKSGKIVAGADIHVLDYRNEKVIANTTTNSNGHYKLAIKPGRYNLYVNGEFIGQLRMRKGPHSRTLKVPEYLHVMQKPDQAVLGVGVGGLAAIIGASAVIGIVTAVAVSNSDDDGS